MDEETWEDELYRDLEVHREIKYSEWTIFNFLRKYGEEFGELSEAVAIGELPAVVEEATDIALLMWDLILQCGRLPAVEMRTKMHLLQIQNNLSDKGKLPREYPPRILSLLNEMREEVNKRDSERLRESSGEQINEDSSDTPVQRDSLCERGRSSVQLQEGGGEEEHLPGGSPSRDAGEA